MKDEFQKVVVALSFITFVTSTFIGCLILGYYAGSYCDDLFSSYPKGRIGGLVAGMVIAAVSIYKHLKFNFIDTDREKHDR